MATASAGNSYSIDPEEVLRFQQKRILTALFTSFLITLEDLGLEHDTALDKLTAALPAEYKTYVDLADYFDEDKGQILRKRVLDRGNHAVRELDEVTRQFSIAFR